MSWSRGYVDDPAEVVIATETDRGLFVGVAGRCRLHGVGGEPDVDVALSGTALDVGREVRSGDAKVLADLARTDAPQPPAGRR